MKTGVRVIPKSGEEEEADTSFGVDIFSGYFDFLKFRLGAFDCWIMLFCIKQCCSAQKYKQFLFDEFKDGIAKNLSDLF